MIKKILLGLVLFAVLVVVVFVAAVSTRPDSFVITRSATIPAPPAQVFPHVNDLRKWQAWSPWARLDPNAKETISDPSVGQGASFAWAGNNDIGEGKMTITDSKPNEQILIDLEFIRPFAGTNLTEFTFEPKGDQTLVTWTMSGKNGFMGKAISLFIDCDKMCGDQFNQGFENLKKVVQSAP